MKHPTFGTVYLVGAGPGDPGLLTLRGRDILTMADVVVHDALANDALLKYCPGAERIFVGKHTSHHTLLQAEINELLIEQARKRACVVRLKGGDPFVFGRGGEEALALAEAGVPFEVVPGVTAGIAAPAYAGIPVTHRGMAASCAFITGHIAPNEEGAVDLTRLALDGTLCFFMGVRTLPHVFDELVWIGRKPGTPAAAIEWGASARQRTIQGTLETLPARAAQAALASPALIVVGEVTSLHEPLSWFEQRPLFGKRIAVTRSQTQASSMVQGLRERGAAVFEFPTIQIEAVEELEPFGSIADYDWVVFTSVNAVDMLCDRLLEQGHDARAFAHTRICVVGQATATAVRKRFLGVDVMPQRYVAEELLEALRANAGDVTGQRFLLPRADIARSFLPESLREAGAIVTELVTYRTTAPKQSQALIEDLMRFRPNLVTFTSSSTARNFRAIIGDTHRDALVHGGAQFASIGPMTTQTARDCGLPIAFQAQQHDIPHFIEAVVQWADGGRGVP